MGGVSSADIQLGVGAPLTGSQAAFGEQIKRGVEAAVAEANAKGGMNGEQITIVYGDDAADPKQGISVANKFVGDGVQFVIGHFNSGVSIPTSDIYAENGVLMIAPGTTNPTFTERELWNTFRTCRRDDQQGIVAGNISPTITRTAKSQSFTTRPLTVRALPTKPRSRSTTTA